MNEASNTEEATFIGILAILCILIGTFLMITSVFQSIIPLFLGAIITFTG